MKPTKLFALAAILALSLQGLNAQSRYGYRGQERDHRGNFVIEIDESRPVRSAARGLISRIVEEVRYQRHAVKDEFRGLFRGPHETEAYYEKHRQAAVWHDERPRRYKPPSHRQTRRDPRTEQAAPQKEPAHIEIVRPRPQPSPGSNRNARTDDTVPSTDSQASPRPNTEPKSESAPAPDPKQSRGPEPDALQYPMARPSGKKGIVYSPFPPHGLLDVSDIEPGGLARDPDASKIFRVPE